MEQEAGRHYCVYCNATVTSVPGVCGNCGAKLTLKFSLDPESMLADVDLRDLVKAVQNNGHRIQINLVPNDTK